MSYLAFEKFTPSQALSASFDSSLEPRLQEILRKYKKTIRVSFHQAIHIKDVYLVMLVGSADHILIELAKKFGFPRGFPILWVAGSRVQTFGFYPKFDNDDRQSPDDLNEFDNVTSLSFSKKWSGFLGQLIAFEIESKMYWTVTSKNSADHSSQYVADACRLLTPFVTKDLLDALIKNNFHICAEIISKNDQTHGCRVLKETPIITAIGKKPSSKNFVDFLDNIAQVEFCVQYGLPCDSSITVNNGKEFIQKLSANRDFMTDTKLEEMLVTSNVVITKGNITHREVLGDRLEGLVIKMGNNIKKYKFPNYTVLTMLLREVFVDFSFSSVLMNKAKSFVDHWCVTDIGREHWYKFALKAFVMRREFVSSDANVGDHIQIADSITGVEDAVELFNSSLSGNKCATVVICMGPLGSGKSSFAEALCDKDEDLVHIDGDILGLDMDTVMKLGKERNDYTIWKIIEALMHGKVPVVSTGGGVLFSQGKAMKFILSNKIQNTLNVPVRIILCLANNAENITELDKHYNPVNYNDLDAAEKAIIYRVKTGAWTIDPKYLTNKKISKEAALHNFAGVVAKKTSENSVFAKELIKQSDLIFGFPIINEANYGMHRELDMGMILSQIKKYDKIPSGKFSQIRLLMQVDNLCGVHITWKFSMKNDIVFSTEEFEKLSQNYNNEPGHIIELKSGTSLITFAVPEKPIHEDGSTHITINLGAHAAKETGTIVRAMNAGLDRVCLPTPKGDITYSFDTMKKTDCLIHCLGAFGI